MDNVLAQVSGQVELGNEVVGFALLAGQVELLKLALLLKNPVDLYGEYFIPFLLSVKVFGAFGGIVYNLGDLEATA